MSDPFGPGEKGWAAASHLATFAGLLFPFAHVLGPLAVWLLKRKTMPFVNEQAKEAMNFQISITLYALAAALLASLWEFFLLLLLPLAAAMLVFVIIAAVRSYRGVHYRYPLIFRVIR